MKKLIDFMSQFIERIKGVGVILAVFYSSFLPAQTYTVSTVAGNGTSGNINGSALNSELNHPYGVKSTNDSLVYFADVLNHCIKKLNTSTNIISLVAGTGSAGHQDGIGSSAMFNGPVGVFYTSGYLYVVESSNYIRLIDLGNNNTVSTLAGSGIGGFQNGSAGTAKFNNPTSIYVESNGDIYVADYGNHCIRLISGGTVSTFAGIPTSSGLTNGANATAKFNLPRDITKDSKGNFYIADLANNCIRKISGGVVSTFCGTGAQGSTDGIGTAASFYHPTGICVTAQDYFYVSDAGNNKVRKIDSTGTVTAIAGTGTAGFADGSGSSAEFNDPEGICYDIHGKIYVGDAANNRLREVYVPEVDCAPSITISGVTSLCSGNGTVLTATGTATSYTWSLNAGGVTTNTVSVEPSTTTIYTVSGSNATGCIGTNTVTITVSTTPTLNVNGDTMLCSGNSTTLTGQGATSYTWNTGSVSVNSPSITISPSGSATYTITGANGACVSSETISITVIQTPVLAIAGSTNICSGNGTILAASGATSYSWSANAGSSTTPTVSLAPGVTTTYTLTGANGSCVTFTPVTVNVTATPTLSVSGNTNLCSGNNGTTLTGLGATSYTWNTGSISVTTSSISANPSGSVTFTLTGSNGGCVSTEMVPITVTPTPTLSVSGATSICAGQTTTLTASGASSYTWSVNAGSATTSTVSLSPLPGTTTYTLTGANGSCIVFTPVTVSVTPTPTVGITATASVVCQSSPVTLTASGAASYTWSANAGSVTTSSTSVNPQTSSAYTVTGGNGNCLDSATITINTLPNPTVTVNSVTVCTGSTATLTANGASSYTWNPQPQLSNMNGSTVLDNPGHTTTYTITGTGSNGCPGTTTAVLTVDSCSTGILTPNEGNGVSLYPNPSNGDMIIELNAPDYANYTILNSIGQEVKAGKLQPGKNHLNVVGLPEGVYNVLIRQAGKTTSTKLLLQK